MEYDLESTVFQQYYIFKEIIIGDFLKHSIEKASLRLGRHVGGKELLGTSKIFRRPA